MNERVTSRDGTPIAFAREGSGPAVVLVTGGLDDGSENAPLVPELAGEFTVLNYARRGRGWSGDTLPYALEREIEDLDALIAVAGGSAHLYGVSSGGALVLEAAAAGLAVDRIAMYEVPYSVGEDASRWWSGYVDELRRVLAADGGGAGVELFMRFTGASEETVAEAKAAPYWPGLEAIGHTLAYDAACLGDDGRPPAERLATISQPALVATGRASTEATMASLAPGFFDAAADAIVAALPNAERVAIEGQGHVVDPKALAPLLGRFFGA
jgi:hypothetical protein